MHLGFQSLQNIFGAGYSKLISRQQALTGFAQSKTAAGPLIGAAGELIVEFYLNHLASLKSIQSFNYTGQNLGPDFNIINIHGKQVSVDVKTKRRTTSPRCHFEMSVPAYLYSNPHYSDPDYFLAVQVNTKNGVPTPKPSDFIDAWIVGNIDKFSYLKFRQHVPQGSNTGGAGGITGKMPTDVYNVRFGHLNIPSKF